MKTLFVILSVVFVISSTGCAGYWANRGKDLADIGKANIGFGLGLGVDVQATDFIHPSIGLGTISTNVGYENRNIWGKWNELDVYFPFILATPKLNKFSSFREVENTWEISYFMINKEYREKGKPVEVSWVKRMSFEVSASALFISARVGVNPAAALKFILGFTGINIAGDDEKEVASVETKPQIEGKDNPNNPLNQGKGYE